MCDKNPAGYEYTVFVFKNAKIISTPTPLKHQECLLGHQTIVMFKVPNQHFENKVNFCLILTDIIGLLNQTHKKILSSFHPV